MSNELMGSTSASLRLWATDPFEEMSQRRRAVVNTESDIGPAQDLNPKPPSRKMSAHLPI